MANITDLKKLPFSNNYVDWGTNDLLYGTAGDDFFSVYGGNDVVLGGAGNDTIIDIQSYNGGASGYDTVNAGAGNDFLFSSFDGGNGYDGGVGIDTLNVVASNSRVYIDLQTHYAGKINGPQNNIVWNFENVTGSAYDDWIIGDSLANTINGYNGNDYLFGLDGADTLIGNRGHDSLTGGNQNDVLSGGDGNDALYGDNGNDTLLGSVGADYCSGGLGRDVISGGDDGDLFVFSTLAEAGNGALADVIIDFERNFDDIDVSFIDANANVADDQAFTFIGTTGVFGGAAQIRRAYDAGSNTTSLLFNTDADQAAEMTINLAGTVFVSAGDFHL